MAMTSHRLELGEAGAERLRFGQRLGISSTARGARDPVLDCSLLSES